MPVFVLILHLYVTLDMAVRTVSATHTKIVLPREHAPSA